VFTYVRIPVAIGSEVDLVCRPSEEMAVKGRVSVGLMWLYYANDSSQRLHNLGYGDF
jgi:hypothetical protein